ncbi:MAG: hypothetical protein ACK56F_11535 [bacterium]
MGVADGCLERRQGLNKPNRFQTHSNSIDSLYIFNKLIISGGRDQCICISNPETLQRISQFDLKKVILNSVCLDVRSVCLAEDAKTVLIGTYGSEIFECEFTEN